MSDKNETPSAQTFQQELETQIEKIENAIAAVPDGEIGDLQALDRDVSDLCNRLENAPREVARETESLMSTMIARLEELEQKLRSHQDQLDLGTQQATTEQDQTDDNGDG